MLTEVPNDGLTKRGMKKNAFLVVEIADEFQQP